jgi:asparagine synthase (glutamine-hydrolysing)
MCGVFGFWLKRPLSEAVILSARSATNGLSHRGPDGMGEWYDKEAGIYLGHTRLSIVDLTPASDQPMREGGQVMVFNGEIYNYKELRDELISLGENLETLGDTEVLFSAWRRWGINALDRIDGMFAAAIFDRHGLHLITDHFGEKPLYILENEDGIYFSSEANTLISLLGLEFFPDQGDINSFLSLGFIPQPRTGFKGLSSLQPGRVRHYINPLKNNERVYFSATELSPQRGGRRRFSESDLDDLGCILTRLVRRRLRSDVPVGLFLSSGVDSALIGALASRELGVKLNSLTVAFRGGVDEAPKASLIAKELGLPHEVIDSYVPKNKTDIVKALIELYGSPNDNLSGLSTYQMALIAKEKMTVALGGLGGDEAFFGYNKYHFLYRYRWIYKLSPMFLKTLSPINRLFKNVSKLRSLERLLYGDDVDRFLSLKNVGIGSSIQAGLLKPPSLGGFYGEANGILQRVKNFDITQTLPASYAVAVDRGAMRAGVEVRTPYLARELFEFTSQFAPAAFFVDGQKGVLKRLLSRYLPDSLVSNSKRGFVSPLDGYLSAVGKKPYFYKWVDPNFIESVWANRFKSGFSEIALRLLILEQMLKK